MVYTLVHGIVALVLMYSLGCTTITCTGIQLVLTELFTYNYNYTCSERSFFKLDTSIQFKFYRVNDKSNRGGKQYLSTS